MLLNFQKTFAMDVWTGLKRQTIRSAGQRKHVPKVGEVAHCYTGLRTRGVKLLGRVLFEDGKYSLNPRFVEEEQAQVRAAVNLLRKHGYRVEVPA